MLYLWLTMVTAHILLNITPGYQQQLFYTQHSHPRAATDATIQSTFRLQAQYSQLFCAPPELHEHLPRHLVQTAGQC